jgi:hypothetical protein
MKLIFGGDTWHNGQEWATPEPVTLEVGMAEADFSNKGLQAAGAVIVAAWISHKDNGALLSLDMSSNNLCVQGTKLLAKAIECNQTMTSLNISSNAVTYDGKKSVDMSGVATLADALPTMGALYQLILKDNRLATAEAGVALGEALKCNTVLKELDISGNCWDDTAHYFGDKGDGPGFAKGISKGLSGNGALSKLIFGGDRYIGDGHKWVTPEPATLGLGMAEVDLSNKGLQTAGAIIVAAWISHRDKGALIKLDISGNAIGAEQERDLQRICVANGIELAK